MRTDELDFSLPPELIAQEPPVERTASRLLRYQRSDKSIEHRSFRDLPKLLRAGDLLIFNDTRVLPARFMLRKPSGGSVEGLFLEETGVGDWRVLLRNMGSAPVGTELKIVGDPAMSARIRERGDAGEFRIVVSPASPADLILAKLGRMPLPPYIRRDKHWDARDALDRERYQTVFASRPGAVAAPTAALHFSPELFAELEARGVERAFVTLDVGLGTFKPVTADRLEAHTMHREHYAISAPTAAALNRAKAGSRRIVAVGTTSARVLESQPANEPFFERRGAETSIFIYPPYQWRHILALVTNFHLPRSTLIALVAAMTGLEEQRRLYRTAIDERYRFFSYGDAMLIE